MTYFQIVKHLKEQRKKYIAELNTKELSKAHRKYVQDKLDSVNKVLEPFKKGEL